MRRCRSSRALVARCSTSGIFLRFHNSVWATMEPQTSLAQGHLVLLAAPIPRRRGAGPPAIVQLITEVASRFSVTVSEKFAAESVPVMGAFGQLLSETHQITAN